MSDMIEIVLEFVLLGTIDAIPSKRVPMILRALAAAVLLAICLGLFTLLLAVGINTGSVMLIAVAFAVLIAIGVLLHSKVRQITRRIK